MENYQGRLMSNYQNPSLHWDFGHLRLDIKQHSLLSRFISTSHYTYRLLHIALTTSRHNDSAQQLVLRVTCLVGTYKREQMRQIAHNFICASNVSQVDNDSGYITGETPVNRNKAWHFQRQTSKHVIHVVVMRAR